MPERLVLRGAKTLLTCQEATHHGVIQKALSRAKPRNPRSFSVTHHSQKSINVITNIYASSEGNTCQIESTRHHSGARPKNIKRFAYFARALLF